LFYYCDFFLKLFNEKNGLLLLLSLYSSFSTDSVYLQSTRLKAFWLKICSEKKIAKFNYCPKIWVYVKQCKRYIAHHVRAEFGVNTHLVVVACRSGHRLGDRAWGERSLFWSSRAGHLHTGAICVETMFDISLKMVQYSQIMFNT